MLAVNIAPLSRMIRNKLVFNIVLSGFKKSRSLINKKPFSHRSKKSPYPIRKSRRLTGDITYNINHLIVIQIDYYLYKSVYYSVMLV